MSILRHFGRYTVKNVPPIALITQQGPTTPQVGDTVAIPGTGWALMGDGRACWAIELNDGYGAQFNADDLEEVAVSP